MKHLAFALFAASLSAQPIMPALPVVEDDGPEIITGRVEWTKPAVINPDRYEWAMAGQTNSSGSTTGTFAAVAFNPGTNTFAVRAFIGTNAYAPAMTNFVLVTTNTITYAGVESRAMATKGGVWGPWTSWTNAPGSIIWPTNFQQQFQVRLIPNVGWTLEAR